MRPNAEVALRFHFLVKTFKMMKRAKPQEKLLKMFLAAPKL